MPHTLKLWAFMALMMGVLLSVSVVNELQATGVSSQSNLHENNTPPISQKNPRCHDSKPYWNGETCVECIYTLDCVGNRICDNKKCLCPGKQTFNSQLNDCACDEKKYPTGAHVNPITCACEKGYELVKKQEGVSVCMTKKEAIEYKKQLEKEALDLQRESQLETTVFKEDTKTEMPQTDRTLEEK